MRPYYPLLLASLLSLTACVGTRDLAPSTPAPAAPTVAATTPAPPSDNFELDGLKAITWARTSTEAEALYLQGYQMARLALDLALTDTNSSAAVEQTGNFSSLPPAIIVDVDETVLDTSDHMVDRLRSGQPFTKKAWNEYVQRANATPLPGALSFLKYAASRGVTIFYVSNREALPPAPDLLGELEPTRRNLAQFGFPNSEDSRTFLFRDASRGWKEKSPRRAVIAQTHRIVLMAGDNLYDFIDVEAPTREKRDAAIEARASWLGTRWIVLPNPMYGSWESVLFGQQSGAAARRAALESVGVPGPAADTIAKGGFEP